jgi:PAS domain S-box-containing protein
MAATGETARKSVMRSFLVAHRGEILALWRQSVTALPDAQRLTPIALVDHVPDLIDELADIAAASSEPGEPHELMASRHALDRIAEGFDVTTVVRELSLLRKAVLDVWHHKQDEAGIAELRGLDLAIDRVIEVSVARYAQAREDQYRQLADDRERTLAKLESLLAASPVGIAFLDHDLRYVRINEALATMNGKPAERHVGRTVAEILGDAAPQAEQLLHDVIASGQPALNLEFTLVDDSGNATHELLANYFPVRSLSGAILGVGGVVLDVTGRKRMEEELRVAVTMRDDLLAVVSHDLRNPLSTVQLSATLLMSLLTSDERARRHVEMIVRSCARMENLIDDLLDMVRIRAGRFELELRRELVDDIVNEALDLQAPLAAEKGITLARCCEVAGIEILCERNRIAQVFGNLIGNAVKFCRAGDTITVTGMREGDFVQFCVEDTGPGIAPDALPKLFEPYWSGPQHGADGAGLGLYIVRGIVESHRGRVWAESAPGCGARFHFTLPIPR